MVEVAPVFNRTVAPHLEGRDARDIEALIAALHATHAKFAGLPFWTAVGHAETAVWDLLGKTAGLRCVDFMGPVVRSEVPIYLSSAVRHETPQSQIDALVEAVERTGATGAKIKVGGPTPNAPGHLVRAEQMVSAVRGQFGDAFHIYADANGSFDAPRAIALCRMLQDFGVAWVEEPCPFDDMEMTRQVAAQVDIAIAGGEQDCVAERWRDQIETGVLDVLQPDFMYNGGMARTLAVQRAAHAHGIGVAPHSFRASAGAAELAHFAAYAPNLHGLQEYRSDPEVFTHADTPSLVPAGGMISLPTGPGFGVSYDPDLWPRAESL